MLSRYDSWLQEPYYRHDDNDEETRTMSYREWLCDDADNRYHSERETIREEENNE